MAAKIEISDEIILIAAQEIFALIFGGSSDPDLSDHAAELSKWAATSALKAVSPALIREGMERAAEICERNWSASAGIGIHRRFWLQPAEEDGKHSGCAYADAIRSAAKEV